MSLETSIEKTFILPPLITGNNSILIKSLGEDWLAIGVHPDSLHVFYNDSLKEVWKFSAELVDVSLDTLYSPNVMNLKNNQKYVLVSTVDGSLWRIQTPAQRNKRSFGTDENSNKLNNHINSSSRTLFSPPIVTNVRDEHRIYKKASFHLPDVVGLLICCQNGELLFTSTIDKSPSNQDYPKFITLNIFKELLCSGGAYPPMNTDQTDILITGTSKGWVSYQPLVLDTPEPIPFTSMNEPINAIYTLHINHENASNGNLIAHNAMILVGTQGTIRLSFVKENDSNSLEKVLVREYYVPDPVYSSNLYMDRLILIVKDGRAMYLDFSHHVIVDGKLAPINSKSIDLPKNILGLCCSTNSNGSGKLFAITKDGRLIRNNLTVENEQNPHFKLSTLDIRNELRKQIESISKCSAEQRELEIVQNVLNNLFLFEHAFTASLLINYQFEHRVGIEFCNYESKLGYT
ncbi:9245_t:CDS:2 [Ambispora leptoticha]|uniref:9245_t:CDS:1 n=1 Tax=Ambispora leptoticha TaxID=144679 RepID=A0A9N9AC40_9GLOM|nr:9245_t:CDS:2 [Ambispora leptoticha]